VNQEVRVQLPSDTPFTRVCSWESRQPPKLLHGVRLLALVLMSRWCSGTALDPPKVQALVQIQVGILIHAACECAGLHGSPRNFTTTRIHAVGARVQLLGGLLKEYVLGVCRMSTRLCEGRSPGSIPGEDAEMMTLEPDGTAAACKAAFQWVRLPPASLVTRTRGYSSKVSMSSGQRRTSPPTRVGQVRSVHGL
jgi:hypothetical protein